jgi:hypothetical protein
MNEYYTPQQIDEYVNSLSDKQSVMVTIGPTTMGGGQPACACCYEGPLYLVPETC